MLEALVVTLREGVEAALVVGIIVAFLRREGLERRLPAVWAGIAAAVAGSLVGGWLLYRAAVNEEAFEGVLYVASAVIVATMLVWMARHARSVAGEVRGSLGRIVGRGSARAVGAGLFLFTFLMVAREGVETVLFLSALSLSSGGVLALAGAALGIAAAVVFGVLFVGGSLRVDLGRFFAATGVALGIFVVQLLLNGYHELSEAGWLPASPGTMAAVGPLVRHEVFFIAAVLLLPLLLLVLPGTPRPAPAAAAVAEGAATARLRRAQAGRQRRARALGATLGVGILAVLVLGFAYGRRPRQLSPARVVAVGTDGVRLPLAELADGRLHRYLAALPGGSVRFIAIRTGRGAEVAAALDACEICGAHGYVEEGETIACLHCESAIYPPTIGQTGGCNPVPLATRIEGEALLVERAALEAAAPLFAAPPS